MLLSTSRARAILAITALVLLAAQHMEALQTLTIWGLAAGVLHAVPVVAAVTAEWVVAAAVTALAEVVQAAVAEDLLD